MLGYFFKTVIKAIGLTALALTCSTTNTQVLAENTYNVTQIHTLTANLITITGTIPHSFVKQTDGTFTVSMPGKFINPPVQLQVIAQNLAGTNILGASIALTVSGTGPTQPATFKLFDLNTYSTALSFSYNAILNAAEGTNPVSPPNVLPSDAGIFAITITVQHSDLSLLSDSTILPSPYPIIGAPPPNITEGNLTAAGSDNSNTWDDIVNWITNNFSAIKDWVDAHPAESFGIGGGSGGATALAVAFLCWKRKTATGATRQTINKELVELVINGVGKTNTDGQPKP